jgi:DNA-binding NarL/FixJ family response regulator
LHRAGSLAPPTREHPALAHPLADEYLLKVNISLPAAPMPVAPDIRVVIADDHGVVRDGLRALVEAQPGLQVVGEAADGHEAWRRACELKPDVLVLDLSMPVASGADAATRIRRDCPNVRIVALTMHEERGYVARLLKAGAVGYVLKRTASSELVRAIRAVAAGGSYIDPSLAGTLLTEKSNRVSGDHAQVADITPPHSRSA